MQAVFLFLIMWAEEQGEYKGKDQSGCDSAGGGGESAGEDPQQTLFVQGCGIEPFPQAGNGQARVLPKPVSGMDAPAPAQSTKGW